MFSVFLVSTQRDPDKDKQCGLEKSGILIGLKCKVALFAVAQWMEHQPTNESVLVQKDHWFPSQSGHKSGLWSRPPVGGA